MPTPRRWEGWDRSSVIAWEAIEQGGGVVPEIDEDRTQSPPAWWRYPSALRSERLLDAETKNETTGLYRAVDPKDLAKGDVLVRTRGPGAGVCGKMAVVGAKAADQWTTIEVDAEGRGPSSRPASPLFFAPDGLTVLPQTRIFRARVKKEDTIGHLRELRRDLEHIERTIGDLPLLLAKGEGAQDAVSEKVHDLVDEAWSLVAEDAYDVDRREAAARAYVLGHALGWPGAAESATALLNDVLKRAPSRADALVARGTLALLSGDSATALASARSAIGVAPLSARARWIELRALVESGKRAEAEDALRRFRVMDPLDSRARRLEASGLSPTKASAVATREKVSVQYFATPDQTGLDCADVGVRVAWPVTWRVEQVAVAPETGLLASLSTGRLLLDDGRAERATASIFAQRPAGPGAKAALLRDGVRKMFPSARMKVLAPLFPGSRREQFRERQPSGNRIGEIVTVDKGGSVVFLVLNAPAAVYEKMRDEFAAFARTLVLGGKAMVVPSPTIPAPPPPSSAVAPSSSPATAPANAPAP